VSEKKPAQIYFRPEQNVCPVCGKASYSRSGEHPQCSVVRADAAFKAKQKKRADARLAASARKQQTANGHVAQDR
jgi:hypothetical protein